MPLIRWSYTTYNCVRKDNTCKRLSMRSRYTVDEAGITTLHLLNIDEPENPYTIALSGDIFDDSVDSVDCLALVKLMNGIHYYDGGWVCKAGFDTSKPMSASERFNDNVARNGGLNF